MPENPKIEQLKKVLELLNNGVDKTEFANAFKGILEFLKKKEESFNLAFQDLKTKLDSAVSELKDIKNYVSGEVSKGINKVQGLFTPRIDNLEEKLAKIEGEKEQVAEDIAAKALKLAQDELLPKIPTLEQIEQELPQLGTFIRDALELLQGKERLTAKAIDGLEEIIIELVKKNAPQRLGGGGFSFMAMQQHILSWTEATGTVNGTNKNFTIGNTPNPTNSLEVMVDNAMLFETTDWTYTSSTKTIAFLIAPPTGAKVRYKCLI